MRTMTWGNKCRFYESEAFRELLGAAKWAQAASNIYDMAVFTAVTIGILDVAEQQLK